ncbi:unnamed protein product [Anisakis simplex]|uniref:Chitin-binding type-2 domain-containing protein n=1 Tax=Anisakis simplex TaxID=6269 RepID=A0A3P6N720_ANISI|nr:unnamed protein product [Anisakis simplex]
MINVRLFKKDVEVCGGHATSLPVTETTTEVAQEETTASSTPQPTPLPEFSCHSLPDGIYAQHCSSVFIACSHGRSIPMHCPANLIFDPHLKVCQWKDKVLDCNEVEPTKETPLETTLAPEIVANVTDDNVIASDTITETIPTTAPSGDSTFSCHGLPDGIYSQGCSKTFALCAAGIETSVKCPGRLFYDAQFEMCRVKAKIQECMNPATGDLPEPGNDEVTTEHPMLTMTDVIVNSDEPSLPTEISCVGRPDGMYALGCSTEFVACVAEKVYRMVCPAGLKFEATAKKCLYEVISDQFSVYSLVHCVDLFELATCTYT